MQVIGLCGGSGAGKSLAQEFFAELNIPGIDTDVLYHQLTSHPSACTEKLKAAFGTEILRPDGSLDRGALSALVFCGGEAQASRLALLNQITHEEILKECRKWLKIQAMEGKPAALINAPLLFESGFDRECDITLAILSPSDEKCRRIMARDGLEEAGALRRLTSQHDDDFLREHTDFQILNDKTPMELKKKIYAFCLSQKLITEES